LIQSCVIYLKNIWDLIRDWNTNYKFTHNLLNVPGVPLGALGAGVALGAEVTCGPNVQHMLHFNNCSKWVSKHNGINSIYSPNPDAKETESNLYVYHIILVIANMI